MLIRIIKKFVIVTIITIGFGEGIVGEYRLTGLSILNYDFCRQNTDIVVTEQSGFDLAERIVYTIPQGEILDYSGEEYLNYPLPALNAADVDLWVYFAEDGTATIQQGSTYPTESAGEGCITAPGANAIQEDFSYAIDSDLNGDIPMIDILGFESVSSYKGLPASNISITGSSVFDVVPITPTELSIPFTIDTSSVFNNDNGVIPPNTILPGMTGGYFIKDTDMYSFIDYLQIDPEGYFYNDDNPPTRPSLYLEWHAIDGEVNESGLGDIIGEDEDGDGTDFDSIYGLEKIKVTAVQSSAECGSNPNKIVGDHVESLRTVKYNQCLNNENDEFICTQTADDWVNTCIDFDYVADEGNNLYMIDLGQDPNFNWGGYVTWNSMLYNQTSEQDYLIDDSSETFNSTCMNDDDYSDCSGRIIFKYTPQCVPSFNMRYFMAELQEQCQESDKDECGVCFGNGIPEGYCECYFAILGQQETYCYDFDGDGIGNQNISKEYCPYQVPDNSWVLDCSSLENNLEKIIIDEIGITKTYPNPFNPVLNIEFSIIKTSPVEINIYDIGGRLVEALLNDKYNPGIHTVDWNAKLFSSGIYFVEFKSEEQVTTKRVELIK